MLQIVFLSTGITLILQFITIVVALAKVTVTILDTIANGSIICCNSIACATAKRLH